MDNPWRQLPDEPPYVLPSDSAAVLSFNRRVSSDHELHVELLPEPYLGNPNAPIVLLSLNPGFSEHDHLLFDNPRGRALCLRNLFHEPLAYPFYLLDPSLTYASGAFWWREPLGALIRLVGDQSVATNLCCVEYFPYHSRKYRSWKYRNLEIILDSQRYSFFLVEQAMNRGALIIAMRSAKRWCDQVPGLRTYHQFHACTNWQRPYISPGNLPDAFSMIERIVRA